VNFALLAIIGAAMLALLFLDYMTIEAERAQRHQAEKTVELLDQLRRIGRTTTSSETGQRGYLITLDRRYLEPYRVGRAQIGPALDRLRGLLGEDATPRQAELIDEIDTLARAKFAEMETSVALLEDGRVLDARRAVLTDEGVEAMERLNRAIREMEQIESAALGEATSKAAQAEARALPLLGGLLALLVLAMTAGATLVGRAARADAEAAQAAELARARDRADLLARELNHRVKNLFAVILAIVQMSARGKPEASEVAESISDRIRALLTAHEVTQGESERPVAALAQLVETTIAPYRSASQPATIAGPQVLLPSRQVTPLGLVLHELTTNAVKYGAWSCGGSLDIGWVREGERIRLTWHERGAKLVGPPGTRGFGTMMMDSAARQFGGTITRDFAPDGLVVTIDLPLAE
jgi:two-component sensor histidine kinase/CHASE3 domain sensor protein